MKNITNQKPTDIPHGRTGYILKYIDKKDVKGKRVLDIGCGFGWFEYNMLNEGVHHISGIDMTKADIEMNINYVKDYKVDFQVGSAIALPFKNGTFDTVVSWDVIEHIPKNTEKQMLSEIKRVLKPGGVFYISTPYRSFRGTIFDPAWWLIRHRHYSKKQITSFVERWDNLEILEMDVRGGWWSVLDMLNLYIAKWIFKRERFFFKFFDKKTDDEYLHKKGFNTLFVKGKKSS